MQQDTVNIHHEAARIRTIKVPKIKGISVRAIGRVMNFDVRRSEVPWNVSKEDAQTVFKEIAENSLDFFFVETWIVTLQTIDPELILRNESSSRTTIPLCVPEHMPIP